MYCQFICIFCKREDLDFGYGSCFSILSRGKFHIKYSNYEKRLRKSFSLYREIGDSKTEFRPGIHFFTVGNSQAGKYETYKLDLQVHIAPFFHIQFNIFACSVVN